MKLRSTFEHCLLLLFCLFISHPSNAANIFDFPSDSLDKATLTLTAQLPQLDEPSSDMLRRLSGVLIELKGPQLKDLRACAVATGKPPEIPSDAASLCFIHLRAKKSSRTLEILHAKDGSLLARTIDLGPAAPLTSNLNEDRFNRLTAIWSVYRGNFAIPAAKPSSPTPPSTLKPGETIDIAPPLLPGAWTIDQHTLAERFNGNRATKIEGVKRDLASVTIKLRAPRSYDPHQPCGMVLWVHAMNEAVIPGALIPALDELNLACVAVANAGNECPSADRYQLLIDALSNACAQIHTDPSRIYITGISGGGKISSILAACFPDVFSGSAPVVGLACYENVPIGNGMIWPALFAKPQPALFILLKSDRIAPVTGHKDFNLDSIVAIAEIYKRDGVPIKLYNFEDMAHELPSAARYSDIMRWIDEPWRTRHESETTRAAALLTKAISDAAPAPPLEPGLRKALVEVTTAAPWSDSAWKATELLVTK